MKQRVGIKKASVLTRDFLQSETYFERASAVAPDWTFLTDQDLTHSLLGALTFRKNDPDGVWIFAYGSLIWNNPLFFAAARKASVFGWHRAFCIHATAARGTPESPGLFLGLDRGGRCDGMAYHITEENISAELRILWRREMCVGMYEPHWVDLRDEEGQVFGPAITFVADKNSQYYAAHLSPRDVIERLGRAAGALGTNAEYLFQTHEALASCGVEDREISDLAEAVRIEARRSSCSICSHQKSPATGSAPHDWPGLI